MCKGDSRMGCAHKTLRMVECGIAPFCYFSCLCSSSFLFSWSSVLAMPKISTSSPQAISLNISTLMSFLAFCTYDSVFLDEDCHFHVCCSSRLCGLIIFERRRYQLTCSPLTSLTTLGRNQNFSLSQAGHFIFFF